MDYNSFLTRDFKKPIQTVERAASHSRLNLNRLHMVAILSSVVAIGTLISFFSLDAKATRHAQVLNSNPQNQIVVPLTLPASTLETAASVEQDETEPYQWLSATVKAGDSLSSIFKRNNLDASELFRIMQAGKETRRLRSIKPGQVIRVQLDSDNAIQTLLYDISKFETLAVHRDGDNFVSAYHHKDVEKRINHAAGFIDSSLFEAGTDAGLSVQITMELAYIFGWDVDFALDIRKGDQFTVMYEEHFLDGTKVNEGPIIAAEFINQGNVYRAIRYTDESGRSDYYSPDGLSMRKAFLRTPVDFRRISSRFGKRKHPVLNGIRMHTGVDYAAPRGTPIKAAGDGKIMFKGNKGGYGRAIIIQHGGRYSTLYAHMNSFKQGIHVGKRVKQGQVIGYVGSSGRATGPHLHYEFRVNGVHRNPLTVRLPNAQPINALYKQAFESHAQALMAQLEMHTKTTLALNHQ